MVTEFHQNQRGQHFFCVDLTWNDPEHKKELSDTRQHVLSTCSPAESDTLVNTTIVDIDKLLFDICLTIRKKSRKTPPSADDTTVMLPEARMVKLRKLEAPTFDGNILHWLTFWEQFCVAIHDRDDPEARLSTTISQRRFCKERHRRPISFWGTI